MKPLKEATFGDSARKSRQPSSESVQTNIKKTSINGTLEEPEIRHKTFQEQRITIAESEEGSEKTQQTVIIGHRRSSFTKLPPSNISSSMEEQKVSARNNLRTGVKHTREKTGAT